MTLTIDNNVNLGYAIYSCKDVYFDWTLYQNGSQISINGLSYSLVETYSIWLGSVPSSSTDSANYNVAVGIHALDAITTGNNNVAVGYNPSPIHIRGCRRTYVCRSRRSPNNSKKYTIT